MGLTPTGHSYLPAATKRGWMGQKPALQNVMFYVCERAKYQTVSELGRKKMGRRKDVSNFDKGEVVMARRLGRSISRGRSCGWQGHERSRIFVCLSVWSHRRATAAQTSEKRNAEYDRHVSEHNALLHSLVSVKTGSLGHFSFWQLQEKRQTENMGGEGGRDMQQRSTAQPNRHGFVGCAVIILLPDCSEHERYHEVDVKKWLRCQIYEVWGAKTARSRKGHGH